MVALQCCLPGQASSPRAYSREISTIFATLAATGCKLESLVLGHQSFVHLMDHHSNAVEKLLAKASALEGLSFDCNAALIDAVRDLWDPTGLVEAMSKATRLTRLSLPIPTKCIKDSTCALGLTTMFLTPITTRVLTRLHVATSFFEESVLLSVFENNRQILQHITLDSVCVRCVSEPWSRTMQIFCEMPRLEHLLL